MYFTIKSVFYSNNEQEKLEDHYKILPTPDF